MWFFLHSEGVSLMDGDHEVRFQKDTSELDLTMMVKDAGMMVVNIGRARPKPKPPVAKQEHPRGVWIWQLDKLPRDYMQKLKACGVGRVYLKIFDDARGDNGLWEWQCTPEIINAFKDAGIEVWGWGYHFDKRTSINVGVQVGTLKLAKDMGLDGYVVDAEVEIKVKSTHVDLDRLLFGLKQVFPGKLGYTSLGAVQFHPEIPWKILNEHCDVQMPQLYFEKFTFGTDASEVEDCIAAHKKLGLDKPILPIWGSESDTKKPATAAELQKYLDAFPGSSVWRLPNAGERGEAFNLNYDPEGSEGPAPDIEPAKPPTTMQPVTTAHLRLLGGKWSGQWNGMLSMQLTIGAQKFDVCSGAPGAQVVRRPQDPRSVPGNFEPIPQGKYRIGQIEFANGKDNYEGSWGNGLGPVWVAIDAEFSDDRGSFGFHLDSNILGSPGSAGCVVFSGIDDLKRFVAALRKYDPKTLVVDWGLE